MHLTIGRFHVGICLVWLGFLCLHGQASWSNSVCPSFETLKGKDPYIVCCCSFLISSLSAVSHFSRTPTISFAGKTCLVTYWALQSLRLSGAEQWKTHQCAPALIFPFVLLACIETYLWARVRYRQVPALRAGLSVVSCLGNTLRRWVRLGHRVVGPRARQGRDRVGLCSQQAGWRAGVHTQDIYQSLSPVCSFCFLLDCTHRLPTAPWGIALLLPQLQSVHISLN